MNEINNNDQVPSILESYKKSLAEMRRRHEQLSNILQEIKEENKNGNQKGQ